MKSLIEQYKSDFSEDPTVEYTIDEYFELCKEDPMMYALAEERMLEAIGVPQSVDTKDDPRLSRIFQNRIVRYYPAFEEFYGMEDAIERIVSFFRHAAQGLEERKQILYLLGPVGGGKSSLAERLKELMQKHPIYVLKDIESGELCPSFESPLVLFSKEHHGKYLEENYGIPSRYVNGLMGPWTLKRFNNSKVNNIPDLSKFSVVKVYPSKLEQIGISKTEPGDENNQDISALVGKVNIHKLKHLSQTDADAYSYSGGLCRANQGLMEFVEMFKAPIKVLHPLLTATQEGNYMGTEEGLAAIPFNGVVLAHSNESEWEKFKNNRSNEAFLDRIYIVKVPYCLRVSEEVEIYKKLLRESSLGDAPCAPGTLKMLAEFSILTRLVVPENSSVFSKLRVYDGESLKDTDPGSKSIREYREIAGPNEGMSGQSTRFAFKVISQVFNYGQDEVAANPVHLLYVLEKTIEAEQFPTDKHEAYISYIQDTLKPKFQEFIGKEIQTAYLESYSEYGQNLFDRYVTYADHWIEDNEFVDPDTGERFNKEELNKELEKIEKPAQITNIKEFRNEIVKFSLRHQAKHDGLNPKWTEYVKLREVIEKKMFSATEEILPVIAFGTKGNKEDQKKHDDFVNRMVVKGYTVLMVRLMVEWYLRVRKSS